MCLSDGDPGVPAIQTVKVEPIITVTCGIRHVDDDQCVLSVTLKS